MKDKPLEQIITDFRQSLQQPDELKEIYTILGNYRNRALSRNEHERMQELYSALDPAAIKKYSKDLTAKLTERAELDLKYMENIEGHPTPRITTGRFENAVFALDSYAGFVKKLSLSDALKAEIKRLSYVYSNAVFSDNQKYANLDFTIKNTFLAKKSRSLKKKSSSIADSVGSVLRSGFSAVETAASFGYESIENIITGAYSASSSVLKSRKLAKTVGTAAAGSVFLAGLAGMMTGSAYICENSELFGTSCAISTVTGELIYSLVGAGLGYVGFDESKPLTVASGLGLGALSTIGSFAGTKIMNHLLSTPLESYPKELDWISGISGGILGTPALALAIIMGLAAAFGDSK